MNNCLALQHHKDNNIIINAHRDKRRDPRIFHSLSVIVKKDGEKNEMSTLNIIRGGAFIKTDNPLSLCDIFDISIYLVNKSIECTGKVIWARFPSEKYLGGIVVRFIDMDIYNIEYLGKFIGEALKKKIFVYETKDHTLRERIQIFDFNVSDIRSDCLVLFVGEDGELLDNFSKSFIEKSNSTIKKFYEFNKYSLISIGLYLLPYICDEYDMYYVLIVATPTYFDAHGEEFLRTSILNYLNKTSEQVFNSVFITVFTLFETSFPINIISRILIDTTHGFLKKEHFPRKVSLFITQKDENVRYMFENKIKEIFV